MSSDSQFDAVGNNTDMTELYKQGTVVKRLPQPSGYSMNRVQPGHGETFDPRIAWPIIQDKSSNAI